MRAKSAFISLAVGAALSPAAAWACDTVLTTERVASGLTRPVYVTFAPGDTSRLFIVEQRSGTVGRIRILNLTTLTLNATPFLSVNGVSTGSEQGLLGLAFHPDYQTNGLFYVNYTNSGGTTIVARYSATPPSSDVANPTGDTIAFVTQPQPNHNGGWMGFGPDGYLYIATGDGGNFNDSGPGHTEPGGNSQDLTANLLGKMLRIDVNGDDFPADTNRDYRIPPDNPFAGATVGDDEIFAYGLRNPWRNSIDRETGDWYIADVGQDAIEEVNYVPAGTLGGRNFGWRCMEGLNCTGLGGCTCNSPALTMPVHTYNHGLGISITGGYVYRGARIPDLRGTYFFADFGSSRIWSFKIVGGAVTAFETRTTELDPPGTLGIFNPSSFGEDANGEIYICDYNGGEVFRITNGGPITGDMNLDGTIDFFDIDALLLGIFDPAAYLVQYGISPVDPGDVNCDLSFDFFDIDPWLDLLL